MILTGSEIVSQVKQNRILIDPFNIDQVNPNSYNFRLGEQVKVHKNRVIDFNTEDELIMETIPESGLMLNPDTVYLAHTDEVIGSDYFVPIIHARSSTARLGRFVHITCDIIELGSYDRWTLQLHAVRPVRVFQRMLIGQVSFWCIAGERQPSC